MNLELYLFYLFSVFGLISSVIVINLRNAVHSILFLILTFCNIIVLFLLIGSEFLSFMFLIVYVGAIAVLFLFVVMMLNIKFMSYYKVNDWSVILVGFIFFFSFIYQVVLILNYTFETPAKISFILLWNNWFVQYNTLNNVQVVGNILYTKYGFLFIICGFILFTAMIGVIVLTMHKRSDLRTQNINVQLQRLALYTTRFLNLRK